MLIEADLLIRTPLAEYLRECGFRVIEAFNATEARAVLAGANVEINTILLDADMPEESGFVFAAWIRENHPGIEVILGGNVAKTTQKAGDLCEEGPAVTKPYDHKFVLDEIRRRLAARDRNKDKT